MSQGYFQLFKINKKKADIKVILIFGILLTKLSD